MFQGSFERCLGVLKDLDTCASFSESQWSQFWAWLLLIADGLSIKGHLPLWKHSHLYLEAVNLSTPLPVSTDCCLCLLLDFLKPPSIRSFFFLFSESHPVHTDHPGHRHGGKPHLRPVQHGHHRHQDHGRQRQPARVHRRHGGFERRDGSPPGTTFNKSFDVISSERAAGRVFINAEDPAFYLHPPFPPSVRPE